MDYQRFFIKNWVHRKGITIALDAPFSIFKLVNIYLFKSEDREDANYYIPHDSKVTKVIATNNIKLLIKDIKQYGINTPQMGA